MTSCTVSLLKPPVVTAQCSASRSQQSSANVTRSLSPLSQQSFEPGMTVSLVARQHGVAASQLFLWRKQYQEGSLTAVAAG
ncbi:transposase, partial [Escherichia coli]|uniref:transposase n=1 Tax=Escherichia coli TaxID=562 RepID=UPI003EE3A82B